LTFWNFLTNSQSHCLLHLSKALTMKRLFTLLMLLSSTALFAQDYTPVGWYNYGYNLDGPWGFNVNYYYTYVFPDSTVQVSFSNGMGYVWQHGLGQVLDPTSEWWDNGVVEPLGVNDPYQVDSVGFWYRYFRPQTEFNDSLVIQFFKEENVFQFYENPWEGTEYDGRSYARMAYDTTTLRGTDPFLEIVETMDDDDVFDTFTFKSYPIFETVEPGEVVGMTVTYYPGNPYNVNDTLDHFMDDPPVNKINAFVMNYYSDDDLVFETGIYNHALIARASGRYNDNSNGWGGQYWPGIASGGGIFHGDVDFHISRGVGIEEHAGALSAITAYPNPFQDDVTVEFSLEKASRVDLSLYDLSGRVVWSEAGFFNQGEQRFSITDLELPAGAYSFVVSTADHSLNGKIIKQ
jgi:hypothetical protein